MERPTEDTYVAELVSVIKEIGGPIGFDAEFNWKTPSGKLNQSVDDFSFCMMILTYFGISLNKAYFCAMTFHYWMMS